MPLFHFEECRLMPDDDPARRILHSDDVGPNFKKGIGNRPCIRVHARTQNLS